MRFWCTWGCLVLALLLTQRLAEAAGRTASAHYAMRSRQKASVKNRARDTSARAVLLHQKNRQNKLRQRKIIAEVPFFSAHSPLKEHIRKGEVSFQFKEPRHLMMIHSAETGVPLYGYTEKYPPRPGDNGTLILLHERYARTGKVVHWTGSKQKGPVAVWGQPGPQFTILSVGYKAVPGFEQWAKPEKITEVHRRQREEPNASDSELPLFVGKVMLSPDSDPRSRRNSRETSEQKKVHNKKLELWDALMSMRVVKEEEDKEGYLGPHRIAASQAGMRRGKQGKKGKAARDVREL